MVGDGPREIGQHGGPLGGVERIKWQIPSEAMPLGSRTAFGGRPPVVQFRSILVSSRDRRLYSLWCKGFAMSRQSDGTTLSPRQMEIMNIIWARGKATVAEVWEEINRRHQLARNTVLTLMTRLEEKGWLGHEEEGQAYLYFARRRREATLRGMVQQLVDTAFAGSADSLVMALLEGRGVSSAEAERIRAMIEAAERPEKA